MKIIPLGDKVVVQPIEAEETTAGGIVLPDTAREQSSEGRIVSVGSGWLLPDGGVAELQVSEGDRVLYSRYAGTDVDCDGDELLILSESEILAVVG